MEGKLMLTKEQLQRIAQRNRIGLQVQERDYIQHLFLRGVFTRHSRLFFKGGTALRVLYHSPRYSEDLDFNTTLDLKEIKEIFKAIISDLSSFGVIALFRNEWKSEVSFNCDLSFKGPLYDGRDRSKGTIRIDISLRSEKVETEKKLVFSDYDDVFPFIITVLTAEHLFAEKVCAFFIRGKARDLFDLWFFVEKGHKVDISLINKKLRLYNLTFKPDQFIEKIESIKNEWNRDLRHLLVQIPDFDMVKKRILSAFSLK